MIPAVGLMMIPRESLDLPVGQIGVRLLCVEGESVLEDGERGWIRPEGESE